MKLCTTVMRVTIPSFPLAIGGGGGAIIVALRCGFGGGGLLKADGRKEGQHRPAYNKRTLSHRSHNLRPVEP